MDLYNFFDRVVLINLKRRPDRLQAVKDEMKAKGWSFREPQIFEAIDGNLVPTPTGWREGGGAYGCRQSHCQILERAIMDGVKSLLVLEDDLCMRSSFQPDIERFLTDVPSDWQQLMLGGQHMHPPRPVKPGVVRALNCQRTHAYAIRGRFLRDLYSQWMSVTSTVHIDWQMGPMQVRYPTYAPEPFLFGQARSHSDIAGRMNPTKFWTPPSGQEWVVLLNAPAEIVRQLREYGIHTGYDRDLQTDIDRGLLEVFRGGNVQDKLYRWIRDLQWECASEEGLVLAVWHPEATTELVRTCWTGPVVEIHAQTLDEALLKLPSLTKRKHYAKSHVIVLQADKASAGILRGVGWHMGYWRDPVTDQDNGLREWAVHKDQGHLAEIIQTLAAEAETLKDGVACLWHDELTADLVRAATDKKVVLISAQDSEEALQQWRQLREE